MSPSLPLPAERGSALPSLPVGTPSLSLGPQGTPAGGVLGWWRRPMVRPSGATLIPFEAHIRAWHYRFHSGFNVISLIFPECPGSFVDCSFNCEGLDTPCGLSYLFCPSKGQGRPLFLPYSLSLSQSLIHSLSQSLIHPLSQSVTQSPFPSLSFTPSLWCCFWGCRLGWGWIAAALVYHSPRPPICRRGSHEDILYEFIINTIRKPDAWSGHGWSTGKRKSTRIHWGGQ